MSSKKSAQLVPELRFPEFQNVAAWSVKVLEDLLVMPATYGIVTAGEFQQQGIPMLRGGDIKEGKVGDGLPLVTADIHAQYRRTILQERDVVIALVGYPGEAAVVPAYYIGANISRAVGLLRLKNARGAQFLVSFLNSPVGRRTVLKPSAGSAQIVVNLKHLNALLIPIPTSAEQQKIADCLSSLDELIAAQARKVDILKTHKTGLMQQLFSREAETQPRLRFSEFREAGEWVVQSVGDFGKVVTGSTPSTVQPAFYGGGIPFVSPADISDLRFVDQTKTTLTAEGYAETRPIRAGSVLFVCIGSTIGKVAQNVHDCATNQQINAVVPSSKHSDGFVYFALSLASERIALLAGRQAVPIINKSLFSSVRILAPKLPEQQRIASCLSSLDAMIAAETQKVEVLKTHKKGLMQQLFPSLE